MQATKLFSSGLALGLVVFVGFPVHADLIKNLKTDGSIETRAFGIDNETDRNGAADDYRGVVHTRVMVGGSFDLLDDVHSRVLLSKNNRIYGSASENLNTVQSGIVADNAYVKIDKVFDRLDLTMGRQFYGKSDSLVLYFGPQNDDLLTITALDVFRADADIMGWAKFQGVAGKIADTGLIGVNSDTDLFGGELSTDKLLPKGQAGISYYSRRIKGAGPVANNTLNVADICILGDLIAGLGYHADYIQNFGRNDAAAGTPAYDGNAYYLGLTYGMDMSGMPFRAHGEFARGTNRFAAIAPGKRFGIIWGEHSTAGPSTINRGTTPFASGLSNLKVLDAGVGINPIAKLGVDLNWYRFQYDAHVGGAGTSAGTEYDLILSWKHSDNVSLEVNAATFQVGDALRNAAPTGTSPITRLGSDIKIKF